MNLAQLVRALGSSELLNPPADPRLLEEIQVSRVTDKSARVVPGTLFCAYPGVNVDGARFVPAALRQGAVAIVTQSPLANIGDIGHYVPMFRVPDGRAALARLA